MFPNSCWSNVPRQFNLSLHAVLYHSEQKQNQDNCTCWVTSTVTLVKCLCAIIMCVTLKRRQRKKQLSCWKENDKKEVGENDTVNKWIFFDFECTQDEMINCNKGYKPQYHIVGRNCNQYDCHTNLCQQGYIQKNVSLH